MVRSTLPEATCRWLSNYIRGRQSVISCRGDKSKARIVHTGVPQGSNMSPTLFSFYLADMPRPTEQVKRIFYADDITVFALGVMIPDLEHMINGYLTNMSCFLQDNCCCCCLPTPMTLAIGGSPLFPLLVHQPASPSIWPAVQSLRRGLSTNPGVTMWCVCGCSS